MELGDDFTPFTIPIRYDVSIQGCQSGSGPPLLLLHGFPQTHLIWHQIASKLAEHYRVIALDLRGYGGSSKPPSDPSHKMYAKSTLAQDVVTVMDRLNHPQFYLCGHDRGGRVAHQLCINYPSKVLKVMVLDIVPTLTMFDSIDQTAATAYWHWFFLIQAPPFPEQALHANPELWAQKFMALPGVKQDVFHEDALKAYTDLFRDKAGCHAMCEDYRAGATIDLEEQRRDRAEGRRVKCPLKAIWGAKGLVGTKFDAVKEWRSVCEREVEGVALECGHYIPEEKPEELLEHMLAWFK